MCHQRFAAVDDAAFSRAPWRASVRRSASAASRRSRSSSTVGGSNAAMWVCVILVSRHSGRSPAAPYDAASSVRRHVSTVSQIGRVPPGRHLHRAPVSHPPPPSAAPPRPARRRSRVSAPAVAVGTLPPSSSPMRIKRCGVQAWRSMLCRETVASPPGSRARAHPGSSVDPQASHFRTRSCRLAFRRRSSTLGQLVHDRPTLNQRPQLRQIAPDKLAPPLIVHVLAIRNPPANILQPGQRFQRR